jgi:hypothetical protein
VRGCCLPELCRSRGAAAANCTPALRGVRTGEGSAVAARLQQEIPSQRRCMRGLPHRSLRDRI